MEHVEGARSFQVEGSAYDSFMGRYSHPLATAFLDAVGVQPGGVALDVGCGPGALVSALVTRLGPAAVSACDPSPSFVDECGRRHPDVVVRVGRAESLPFEANAFDYVVAQLVLHFVTDPPAAAAEFVRVAKPGGVVGACVWEFHEGMEMLRHFWDAALALDPDAPDEARTLRFGREGEIAELLDAAGLADVTEATLHVSSTYTGFDELWAGFQAGVGPAGSYCVALPADARHRLQHRLFHQLGQPSGPFTLSAVARAAHGRTPNSATDHS
ncbi:MAG: class I SAM-dependent methyltransferase [Acidimicrobiales bacterium]